MIGGPGFGGAVQVTVTLVTEADVTVGLAGTPGASPTSSVTVTVIAGPPSSPARPCRVPPVARTSTT